MFPRGAVEKRVVREWARELDLPVAEKPDSQEICFVSDGSHAAFLESQGVALPAGAIKDGDGRVVGRHEGIHRFTVGQRKGLGLSSPIPLYVVRLDTSANTVTVGPRTALERRELTASGVNWIAGTASPAGARVTVQIRHRHREAPATLTPIGADRVQVVFDEPQSAIAPGQAAVFYDGETVVGGGWID
jgi:tRNA-specific 2-thiouridylase